MSSATTTAVSVPSAPRRFGQPFGLLMATSITMLVVGLLMILSASSVEAYKTYGSSFLFFNRQVIGAVLGVIAMLALARYDYRKLRKIVGPLLVVSIILLVAVLLPAVGTTRGGSSRWLVLGPFTFQPSELTKLSLILYCAHVLERKGGRVRDAQEMAMPVLPVIGVVALLVIAQPDLGTAIILSGCGFVVLFLSGARVRHLSVLAGAGLVAIIALSLGEGYRRARVTSFLDPWADPLNTGYQNIQGQIALGSGGWFGLGLGASRQKWSYIPNAHTDFIYAILGEELGLIGTMAVLLLFMFFLYLGTRIARKAPDRFGFLVAGGITGWIGLQALINMSAVAGLVPITGIPLPLISFGGSSLLFTLAGIGVLLSIARRCRV